MSAKQRQVRIECQLEIYLKVYKDLVANLYVPMISPCYITSSVGLPKTHKTAVANTWL